MENSNIIDGQEAVFSDMTEKEHRVRRVGTFTFGISLIGMGLFFLINIFLPSVGYTLLFKLWPFIFISLGFEVLLASVRGADSKLIYDKTAMILVFIVTMFGLCTAFLSQMIQYGMNHMTIY